MGKHGLKIRNKHGSC